MEIFGLDEYDVGINLSIEKMSKEPPQHAPITPMEVTLSLSMVLTAVNKLDLTFS